MSRQQQSAVLVTEIGKPVILGERDIPTPDHDEVLVKVIATLLLPHDAYGRDWGLGIGDRLPAVLGSNIAGTIEQTGDSVKSFSKGDVIFGLANIYKPSSDQAGTQTYATLSATAIAKVPDGFSPEQAVTLPVNLVTAFQALFTKKQSFDWPAPWERKLPTSFNRAVQTLVIIGAGAAIGKFAVQLARLAQIGTIIAIAGPTNEAELKSLGATKVINRHASIEKITTQVHAITGTDGVTHIFDCRSMTFELAASLLAKTKPSTLITVHPDDQQKPGLIANARPNCKASFIEGGSANLGELESGFWENVPLWLRERKVLPGAFRTVDGLERVDEINEALDGYLAGRGGAQLVVRP